MYVFEPPQPPPPGHHRQTADTARELIGRFDDLLGLDAIEAYFRLHYWKRSAVWDGKKIMECFNVSHRSGDPTPLLFNYRTAAERFRFIEDEQQPVIVPWGDKGRRLVERLQAPIPPDRDTRRALQRYIVQVPDRIRQRMLDNQDAQVRHEFFHVLVTDGLYHPETGLSLDGEGGLDPASIVW